MKTQRSVILVSACLIGLCTRYDGKIKESKKCLLQLQNKIWIPVCPEQLGGLQTPREPADLTGGDGFDALQGNAKVLTKSGVDLTLDFIHGAEQVLQIAKLQNVKQAWLKARSPSCAIHGTIGVTAALLRQHGVELLEF